MHNVWWNSVSNSYLLNKMNAPQDFEENESLLKSWRFVTTIQNAPLEKLLDEFMEITNKHKNIMSSILLEE